MCFSHQGLKSWFDHDRSFIHVTIIYIKVFNYVCGDIKNCYVVQWTVVDKCGRATAVARPQQLQLQTTI